MTLTAEQNEVLKSLDGRLNALAADADRLNSAFTTWLLWSGSQHATEIAYRRAMLSQASAMRRVLDDLERAANETFAPA